ncbi:MAG TPA: hypothetical protein PLA68_13000 [Panacibacter sp.]|nr:hypothetical protein [Panacibacter sp.]
MKKNTGTARLNLNRQTIQKLDAAKLNTVKAGAAKGTTLAASIAIATATLSDAVCIWICATLDKA